MLCYCSKNIKKIVEDRDKGLAEDFAGDPLANVLCNCSKTEIKVIARKNSYVTNPQDRDLVGD
jgi:hypothetical protein